MAIRPSKGFLLNQLKTLGLLMITFENPLLTLPGKTQEGETINISDNYTAEIKASWGTYHEAKFHN